MNIKLIVLSIFLYFVVLINAKFTCECNLSNNETRLISVKNKDNCKEMCNEIAKKEVYSIECDLTCKCKCGNKLTWCKSKPSPSSGADSATSGVHAASILSGAASGGPVTSTGSGSSGSSYTSGSSNSNDESSDDNSSSGTSGVGKFGLCMGTYCDCEKELLSWNII